MARRRKLIFFVTFTLRHSTMQLRGGVSRLPLEHVRLTCGVPSCHGEAQGCRGAAALRSHDAQGSSWSRVRANASTPDGQKGADGPTGGVAHPIRAIAGGGRRRGLKEGPPGCAEGNGSAPTQGAGGMGRLGVRGRTRSRELPVGTQSHSRRQ